MADGAGTAGTALKTISPMLGAIPVFGQVASMATGLIGGALEAGAAQRQAAQAEKARKEALQTQTQALRPEFTQKLRADQMAALSGLPNYDQALANIQANTANQVRTIRESSPTGESTLAAISAALGKENEATRATDALDAQYRADLNKDVRNTMWSIGKEGRYLEDIRDQQKREGLSAAAALENAATYNKQNAANKILGSIGSTAAGLANNYQQQQNQSNYLNLLNSIYGGGNNSSLPPLIFAPASNATYGNNAVSNVTAPSTTTQTPINLAPNSFWATSMF